MTAWRVQLESLLEPEEAAGAVAVQDGIRVGELQQYLKYRHLNSSVDRADPEQEIQAEKDFLRMLCDQLRRADKCGPVPAAAGHSLPFNEWSPSYRTAAALQAL